MFMVRHISIFFLKKEKEKSWVIEKLKELEHRLNEVSGYAVGLDCLERPTERTPELPEFGDIVQMIDFDTAEAATAYPNQPGHMKLMEEIGEYIEKVIAIDVAI